MQSFPFIFILIWLLSSCNTESVDPIVEPIQIDLVSMDDELNEKAEFNKGDNVMLMLKATNLSQVDIELSDFDACSVLNDPQFTKIYSTFNKQQLLVGRCLLDQEYFCIALYLPRIIPVNESIYLTGARWKDNPENTDLPPGKYYSKYTLKMQGREFHTRAEFSIH